MVLAAPAAIYKQANADVYDDQMSALRQQMSQYQTQVDALNKEANSLQAELDNITQQKNAIIAQINLSQQQYDALQAQINDTQQKIAENKAVLGKVIVDIYANDEVSPIEMLASSKNIGDFVDKQEYRSSMRSSLNEKIKSIKALEQKLERSKSEITAVMEQQKGQKADLAAKESRQADLVAKTRGDEAAYQQLVSSAQSQMESYAAQQRAYYASLQTQSGGSGVDGGVVGSFVYANWSGNRGCGGDGYPYCGGQDTYGDPWALLNRECVSYAAWRIDRVYGRKVVPFNWNGTPHGFAYEWLDYAKGATRTYDPQPGDAVVLPPSGSFAPVGHLMVVESVSGDWVHVSQYNFFGTGEYSTMDIKKSGVVFLRFPSK